MSEECTKIIKVEIKKDMDIDVGVIDDATLEETKKKADKMSYLVSMNLGAKIISYTDTDTRELTNNQLLEITCLIKYYTLLSMGKHVSSDWFNTNNGVPTPFQLSNTTSKPHNKE